MFILIRKKSFIYYLNFVQFLRLSCSVLSSYQLLLNSSQIYLPSLSNQLCLIILYYIFQFQSSLGSYLLSLGCVVFNWIMVYVPGCVSSSSYQLLFAPQLGVGLHILFSPWWDAILIFKDHFRQWDGFRILFAMHAS